MEPGFEPRAAGWESKNVSSVLISPSDQKHSRETRHLRRLPDPSVVVVVAAAEAVLAAGCGLGTIGLLLGESFGHLLVGL